MKKIIKKLAPLALILALFVSGCDESDLPRQDPLADTTENHQTPATVDISELREKIEQVFESQKDDFALDSVLIARYDGQNGAEYSIKCVDGMYDPLREAEWRAYASCIISEDVFWQLYGLFQSDTVGISALGFTDNEMQTEQWVVELNGKEASAAVAEVLRIVLGEIESNETVRFVNNQAVSN